MGAFTSEQTPTTDSETNVDDLSEGSDNTSQSDHSSNNTSNKYKFRETDTRLKQIKNKLKIKDEISTSLYTKRSNQNKENKRLSLQVASRHTLNPKPIVKKSINETKSKRDRSKSASRVQNKKNKLLEVTKSKFDVFEFTDDDNIDLTELSSSKKIKRTKSSSTAISLKKKALIVGAKSVNNSPSLSVKARGNGKTKLILNRSQNHLNDIGSHCEGSTSSCLSNLSANSNESFIFNDSYV